jgi:hypothetical protein
MRFRLAIFAAAFFAIGTADASAFAMGFRWCSTGSSPVISLSGVPRERPPFNSIWMTSTLRPPITVEG